MQPFTAQPLAPDSGRRAERGRPPGARNAGRLALALALSASLGCFEHWAGGHGSSSPAAFSMSVDPAALQVPAGGSGYATVTVSRVNGFSGEVAFSVSGAPAGVVAEGSVPSGSSTGRLTFAIAPDVAAQTLGSLSLQGLSGTTRASASFALTVTQALPPSTLSPDLVNAAGSPQQSGSTSNVAFTGEPVAHELSGGGGATVIRHGYLPAPNPSLP